MSTNFKGPKHQNPTDRRLTSKVSPLTSLMGPSNDTNASHLAAAGHFVDSVDKEAHKGLANAKTLLSLI